MKAKELVRHIFEQVKSNWFMPVIEHQVYSTEERVIGVWTDGKPLYQRTIINAPDINNSNGWTDWVDVADYNIDAYMILMIEFNIVGDDRTQTLLDAGNYFFVGYNSTTKKIQYFKNNKSYSYKVKSLVINYTKTTDTSTTSKVPFEPLHEYSTEEKMVGYWIDGKPLYQRTFIKTGAFNPSGEEVEIATLGADVSVISFKGNLEGAAGVFSIPYYQSPSYSVELYMGTNNTIFFKNKWGSGGGANVDKVIAIVEYTKTTD